MVTCLRELLSYDLTTGAFTWRVYVNGRVEIGAVAGSRYSDGYLNIQINGKIYKAHRLAWLYVYGEWPPNDIDHINGVRDDNSLSNLRLATRSENRQNLKRANRDSKSGVLGVCWDAVRQKWHAQLKLNGKHRLNSYHDTIEAATTARREAEKKYFGAFAP